VWAHSAVIDFAVVVMKRAKLKLPKNKIDDFCRRHNVRRLALFGSVLGEDFTPESDVDVLIEFEPGTRIGLRFFALQDELSQIVGRKVDLNTPGFLSKYFRERVMEEAEDQYASGQR
jgi:predicted nucleotidyltransferase